MSVAARPAGAPALGAPAVGAGRGPGVRLEDLAVGYGGVTVVQGVDLSVDPGELLALIGPSGSGKSSLLRCVAGFVAPTAGRVRIGERLVAEPGHSLPPEQRQLGYVFQSHALWPHMTARDNVAYPWRVRRVPATTRRQRAEALLERVGLGGLGGRRPAELSGGERQRVALARALAGEPRLLLLDEPLASVDVMLRDELLDLLGGLVAESGLTTIFTTHDQQEAMTLAHRTAVLFEGRLVQVGTPREVYERPLTSFVARFMGASNVVGVRVVSRCGAATLLEPVPAGRAQPRRYGRWLVEAQAPPGERAVLVARPEDLELAPAGTGEPPGPGELDGVVARTVDRGSWRELVVRAGGLDWRVLERPGVGVEPGEAVVLCLRRCLLLPS